jgi:hypothetical protein
VKQFEELLDETWKQTKLALEEARRLNQEARTKTTEAADKVLRMELIARITTLGTRELDFWRYKKRVVRAARRKKDKVSYLLHERECWLAYSNFLRSEIKGLKGTINILKKRTEKEEAERKYLRIEGQGAIDDEVMDGKTLVDEDMS